MKTAVFLAAGQSLRLPPVEGGERFDWTELDKVPLDGYDALFLIGADSLDTQATLSSAVCAKLWAFAERGGRIYAELIETFDYPGSRLFGLKQDFPVTRRTMEKLRLHVRLSGMAEGELLEWSGALQRGFSVDIGQPETVVLTAGVYKETHHSSGEGAVAVPGLIVRQAGAGRIVYAAFSLFSSAAPEQLRPYGSWTSLIGALREETGIPFRLWEPMIRLAGEAVTPAEAVAANVQWFIRSGMMPRADGSRGVYENIHSVTGRLSPDRRPDCHAHTALMLHLYGRWTGEKRWQDASDRLLHFLFDGGFQDTEPDSPSYGFFRWYEYPGAHPHQLFTDDNAWVCTVLLYLFRKTGNGIYRERGLLLSEALLATQREDGLRPNVLTRSQLAALGREGAAKLPPSLNPHFESITHTAFIQAYLVTGNRAYLDTALNGARTLLARQAQLAFMYSRTSGLTRLLLPLGYLIKHDASGEIEAGLRQAIAYLMSRQHALGGIEEAGNPDPERFGMEDAGVYIDDGEGIADQLYTNNFLLMNSWELWKATGHPADRKLQEGVSAFMRRIQIRSGDERYDGGWMRAFDLNRCEYFGNNGDTGWGPYCMESGWTNAIASAGLLLELLDESLYA